MLILSYAWQLQPAAAQTRPDPALLGRAQDIPAMVAAGTIKPGAIPNPHWRTDGCPACHRNPPRLLDSNVERLCSNCHDAIFDHSYIHPVGDKVDTDMLQRMPAQYREAVERSGGRTSCSTCHDLPAQCLSARRNERGRNPKFFRKGPFNPRTQQCYFCHRREQYQRLNPHEQKTADGNLREATCQLCHAERLKDLEAARGIGDLRLSKERNLNRMCTRCHPWKPHPGGNFGFATNRSAGSDHLVKPSAEIAERMKAKQAETQRILPLEPRTGRIFCATCHDPHDSGVVTSPGASAESGAQSRLRARQICFHCHVI